MGLVNRLLNNRQEEPDYWYRKGLEFCTAGYYLNALEALERMTAANPLHAGSWFLKGFACYQMGQYEKAMQYIDESLSLDPHLYEALTYKGLIFSSFGKHSEALSLYDRALSLNRRYGKAWYVKGLTHAILEQYDDAIAAYEQALAIAPADVDALAGLSSAMKKRDKFRDTPVNTAPVPRAPVHQPSPGTGLPGMDKQREESTAGNKPVPAGAERTRFIPAIPAIDKKAYPPEKRPAPAPSSGKKTEAGAACSPFVAGGTRNIHPVEHHDCRENDTKNRPGNQHPSPVPVQRPNAYEEKIRQYHDSLNVNPADPGAWEGIGNLSMKTGKYLQAAEAYRNALELDDGNAGVWKNLGDAERKLGCYGDADDAYIRSLDLDPGQGPVWISRAKTLAMLGKHEDAIHACSQAILIDESNIDAWLYKGFLLKKVSRHSDALNAYNRVLAISPGNDQAIRQRKTIIDST
jgi:tetratricopeptide (TPR) repeat protein